MRAERFEVDDSRLQDLLDFASRIGTPRATSADAYREHVAGSIASVAIIVRDDSGDIAAAALGTVMSVIASDQVQVNAFSQPGQTAAFHGALDELVRWSEERAVRMLTAHVSAPTPAELTAWDGSGFTQLGRRVRYLRAVTSADAELESRIPEGLAVVRLVDRPELEEAADRVWRRGVADIPSALEFESTDELSIRRDLGCAPNDELPQSLLVVHVLGGDDVVAVAYLACWASEPGFAGHRLTAVTPDWRGRGLAMAIKVELLRWAARHGIHTLRASNDDRNPAMRRVNESLGYEVDHEIVLYRRVLD